MTKLSHKYSPLNIDSSWGSTIDVRLKNTDLVTDYDLVIAPGTLAGGTSPAYTDTYLNPLIQSVEVVADNDTMISADAPQLNELRLLVRNISGLTGSSLKIPMTAVDFSKKSYIKETAFPSYAFVNNTLKITLPPLSQVTSGSPTGTSGSILYLTERVISRDSVNFNLIKYKMLKISATLGLTGDNDLTNFLATDGFYQALLHFGYSAQTAPIYSGEGSNTLINYMDLVINNNITRFSDYFSTLQNDNHQNYGRLPDTGFALQEFMPDTNPLDLLNLSSPVTNKSVNLKINTSATGFISTLKMVMF
ncbi:MAG: hypothetical protein ACYDC6_14240 [Acidobacteriaceae bacterium]